MQISHSLMSHSGGVIPMSDLGELCDYAGINTDLCA